MPTTPSRDSPLEHMWGEDVPEDLELWVGGGTLYHRIFQPFLTYLFHSVNLNRFSARAGTEVLRLSSHTWVRISL